MNLPSIVVEPSRDWCAPHLESFRLEWPRGWVLASVALLGLFLRDPDVIRYCGGDPAAGVTAQEDRIPAALAEFGPLCCRVPPETLTEILEDAHAGRRWRGEAAW